MASYNLVNGRPTHVARISTTSCAAGPTMLLVVSDAYAPSNLATGERYFADHAAAAAALRPASTASPTTTRTRPGPSSA